MFTPQQLVATHALPQGVYVSRRIHEKSFRVGCLQFTLFLRRLRSQKPGVKCFEIGVTLCKVEPQAAIVMF